MEGQLASDQARVSVIIPHFQDLDRLDLCLSALERQSGAPPFEIVVADNMSPAGEAAVRAIIAGRARLTIATKRGAGPARNAGVAALSVNDLRITNVSFIRCIGSTIRCNQYRMLPPFVIKALGDPAQLAAAIAGDPMFSMRQLPDIGLVVKVEMVDDVVIPAFAEADRFGTYITLLEGN